MGRTETFAHDGLTIFRQNDEKHINIKTPENGIAYYLLRGEQREKLDAETDLKIGDQSVYPASVFRQDETKPFLYIFDLKSGAPHSYVSAKAAAHDFASLIVKRHIDETDFAEPQILIDILEKYHRYIPDAISEDYITAITVGKTSQSKSVISIMTSTKGIELTESISISQSKNKSDRLILTVNIKDAAKIVNESFPIRFTQKMKAEATFQFEIEPHGYLGHFDNTNSEGLQSRIHLLRVDVFSFYRFWQIIRDKPDTDPDEIKAKMNPIMSKRTH